jgi:hypothetical protein
MGCPWSHPRLADTGWSLVRKFKKVSSSITVLNVVFVFNYHRLDALCDAHLKDILQTGTDGWLTPVILATQEAKIQEDFCSKLALGKEFSRPHLKKTNHKQNKTKGWWSGSKV